MGSGRDKRRKNEDPEKVAKRAARQATKATRNQKDDDNNNGGTGGLDGEEDIAVTAAKFIKRSEKRKTVLEKDLPGPPEPRSNALWVAHPTRDDEYILFGGECWNGESTVTYNQLIIYNSARNTWREIESPLTPCPRSSCQGWTHRNYLFVHGGEITSRTQSQFLHFRDLWRFDVNLCVWEELSKGKGGPSARSGHRIAQWKRGAVLYGGFYDNGQETRYFDDLWVLSEVDSGGVWREVTMASHVEKPQSRSGHVLSMYNDELFLFGGYYTHRASRFQRAEATVLHDLWTVNMASPTPVWQRLKLAGIPPPIRSGFGHAFKDKRLFLFGGVVDLDGAGGKTVSTFCNDLFVFNMENKRFFPMTLHAPKAKASKQTGAAAAAAAGGDLAAEIAAAVGRKVVDSDSSDDDSVDLLPEPAEPQAPRAALQVTESFVQGAPGQILPCRRMNAHLCVDGNRLVIFGGQFEVGRREVPLCDVFSLNLNKMDTYVCHVSCDVRAVEWLGGDTENSGAGSWEDGSTVADLDALLDRDDDLEEEEASAAAGRSQAPEDDDDDVVPVPAAFAAMAAAATAVDADGRTTVRGKVGRQHHKEQLKAQLSSTSAIPTPQLEETLKQFFDRTESFWLASAAENIPSEGVSARKYEKRLREAAQQYCHMRYDEAIDLLRQIEFVERQQAEEEEALREMLRKRREYEAAAAAAAEAEEAEESEDDA